MEEEKIFSRDFYKKLDYAGIELHRLRNQVLEVVTRLMQLEDKYDKKIIEMQKEK